MNDPGRRGGGQAAWAGAEATVAALWVTSVVEWVMLAGSRALCMYCSSVSSFHLGRISSGYPATLMYQRLSRRDDYLHVKFQLGNVAASTSGECIIAVIIVFVNRYFNYCSKKVKSSLPIRMTESPSAPCRLSSCAIPIFFMMSRNRLTFW